MSLLRPSHASIVAYHALVHLAKDGGTMNTVDLAKALGASESHLSKILQRLVHADLVESVRGAFGGFRLGKPADKLSVLAILELFDGPVTADLACQTMYLECEETCCVLRPLMRVLSMTREQLSMITIADSLRGLRGDTAAETTDD